MRSLLVALLLLGATVGESAAESLLEHYVAGMQARAAGDFATYLQEMQAAEALEPGHPVLQFHLGRACAALDRPTEAFDWLDRALGQGAWLDPDADAWLEPLRTEAGWARLLARADSVGAGTGPRRVGFELAEFDLLCEGIDHDPVTRRFVLGSAHKRKILTVDADGRAEVLVPADGDGLLAVLGVRVDAPRRRLWAVSVGDSAMTTPPPGTDGLSRVHCWSLEDGSLVGRWDAAGDSVRHGFNDLALRADGSVVVTASASGALFTVAPGDEALSVLLPPGTLRGPNGIAIRDGVAWVSEYVYGVARVDLSTGAVERVRTPASITLVGIDGLYLHDDELVAVQNYAGLDRIAAFALEDAGRAVRGIRVLEARHPRMDDPTTGVIVGDEIWTIANSHLARFDARTDEPDATAWGKVLVLRTPL